LMNPMAIHQMMILVVILTLWKPYNSVVALLFVFGLWCSKFDFNLISCAFHIISTIL
jgi:hypothetical protein